MNNKYQIETLIDRLNFRIQELQLKWADSDPEYKATYERQIAALLSERLDAIQ